MVRSFFKAFTTTLQSVTNVLMMLLAAKFVVDVAKNVDVAECAVADDAL